MLDCGHDCIAMRMLADCWIAVDSISGLMLAEPLTSG